MWTLFVVKGFILGQVRFLISFIFTRPSIPSVHVNKQVRERVQSSKTVGIYIIMPCFLRELTK